MQLHHISASRNKKAKRVGRGGKRGTTSGRGTKGQRSRSGHRIRPAVRDLLIRIPKLRGFRNKPLSEKPFVLGLGAISRKLKPLVGKGVLAVDIGVLKEAGLLPARYHGEVKVLGDGEVVFPIAVKGIPVSASAKAKIEKAGGSVSD
jgi:large subunit ribosomal protein L15